MITDDPDEAHRSPADVALLARPPPRARASPSTSRRAARSRAARSVRRARRRLRRASRCSRGTSSPRWPSACPRDAVVSRSRRRTGPSCRRALPARAPLGFVSAAMGGLGFGLPAAAGLRMAHPDRPVVAILGDGASLYAIQALWSAARDGVGVLWVVMANGRYAIMDRLAEMEGARARGRRSRRSTSRPSRAASAARHRASPITASSSRVLDEVIPTLAQRREPLLLSVDIAP